MIISVLIFIQQPEWANKLNQFASNNYLFGLILLAVLVYLFLKYHKELLNKIKNHTVVLNRVKEIRVQISN
jgi:hypothetical protein